MRCPHDLSQSLGTYHRAGALEAEMAIDAANEAKVAWSEMEWSSRATVLLKAAELLAGKYRQTLNAATMLSMSKTVLPGGDRFRLRADRLLALQPLLHDRGLRRPAAISVKGVLNYMEHRPLEGFVFAISPFNFTSIAGNLPTAPALMGNAVVWKPASPAVLPAYYIMKMLKEAGMPDGVINMVPGPGPVIAPPVLNHLDLGGVHFTGSTYVFSTIWLTIGSDIRKYFSYPRIVGETGGKDFIFAHASTDIDALVTAIVRGALRVPGAEVLRPQPASTCPTPSGPGSKQQLLDDIATIKVGDVCDFSNFVNAVIDEAAFEEHRRIHRLRQVTTRTWRSSAAAPTTTARATSSSRPSSRAATPVPG